MRRMALALAAGALLSAGCESSQTKSARLAREAQQLGGPAESLTIDKRSKVVEVASTAVLHDENGTAAVVELRNTGDAPLAGVPVLFDVRGAGGASLFRNDTAGSEDSLVAAAALAPGERLFWVNDQVVVTEEPESVVAEVGAATGTAPAALPELKLSAPRLEVDPASGTAAVGRVTNTSAIEQRQLVIYAVARRGRAVVAAGRAQVPKLKPGGRAPFTVFFIGDAEGAELTLAAPPTVLDAGS